MTFDKRTNRRAIFAGATVSALALLSTDALAQDRVESEIAEAQRQGAEIIVTGTRRTERTAAQSLSPIDVIDAGSLAAAPSFDLNDKIAQSVPSFNVQREPNFDGATFSRPAALRNLSPDETLVLVNGHRRHRSAFVDVANQGAQAIDLAQIPSAAIGRVEVLRDGASAQYGSDAIAGVINIVLDDAPGTVLSAQAGQYYAGDGFGVQATARSGWSLPGGGKLAVAADYSNSNATNRSVGVRWRIGQPELESYHGSYTLDLPLSDSTSLYSFGTYGHTIGWNDFSFRSAQNDDVVFNRSFYQDTATPIFPTWSLTDVYPDGFAPHFGAIVNDGEVVAGVKTDVGDNFSIDASGGYGRNAIRYRLKNSINASLGPLSPTAFDAGEIVSSELSGNLDAAWLVDAGLTNPVSIAFGGTYRHERFDSTPGDLNSYAVGPLADLPSGSYGFPGLSPAAAVRNSRDNVAGYLDIEADLTNALTVGAAGRYEHFSDFGSNFSYKISGRYQLLDSVALRATYNTGFHAPAVGQQSFTKISNSPDVTAPPPYPILTIGLVSPSDPLAIPFGGKPLKPEKSRNISAGLVIQPAAGLTVTADYYHIHVRDRIGLTPNITLAPGAPFNRIQFLINGYSTNTDGVDFVASWRRQALGGQFALTAAYNYNKTKISQFDPVLVTPVLRPIIEDARPNHTLVSTANFDRGPLHLLARVRYYGSFVDALPFDQSPFQNQHVSPVAFVDLSASYDVTPGTQLTVGAENLFGKYPDRNTSVLQFLGFKYPLIRPYEEDGGRWYVRLIQRL